MYIALADNQDITRAGMMYVCQELGQVEMRRAEDKAGLIEQLKQHPDAVVVLDYTLFDINDVEELEILYQRFPLVQWVLFSVDLSSDFVRRVIAIAPRFNILLKESPIQEIRECLMYAQRHQRYICQRMTELLLAPQVSQVDEEVKLTPTEIEILKDIALGQTTNNVHEATKYALRAGLVDSAEYYI